MDLLDTLLGAPGVYAGTVADFGEPEADRKTWTATIEVRPLPGRTAVSLDYECLSQETGRFHAEHTVLGRHAGGLVLLVAHPHDSSVLLLREEAPGHFVDRDGAASFPVELVIETPEPGRITHWWRFGRPGGEVVDRDKADVRLVDPASGTTK